MFTTPRITRTLAILTAVGAVAGSASTASASTQRSQDQLAKVHAAKPDRAPSAKKKLKAKQRRAIERRIRRRGTERSLLGSNCADVDVNGFYVWCYYADAYGLTEVDEYALGTWDGYAWIRGYGWLDFG